MILDYKTDMELEGDSPDGSVEAKISKENLGFIIDLITTKQYSDPIGSIVREITSNCFDAHIEAGVKLPVTIDFNSDELGSYILFKDQGIGMSPDRIKNVYLSYGESTKRLDNKAIGGFGLGGKSPLSYADMFYVTTIFDNTKYEYVVHKGSSLPKIEPLSQEYCSQRNGTEVKIYFNRSMDRYDFIRKCKEQLVYFDNVVFKQEHLFNNDYKILEAEHFKCRVDQGSENAIQYSSRIHLCVGTVAYPIDYDLIKRTPLEIPIALKFEIGDLVVTPNRESLRYVEINGRTTESIICAKLDLAIEELKKKYYKQDCLTVHSLIEYLNKKKEKPTLNLHGLIINMEFIISSANIKCSLLEGYIGEFTGATFEAYKVEYDHLLLKRKPRKDVVHLTNKDFIGTTFYEKKGKISTLKNQYLLEIKEQIRVGKITFLGWNRLLQLSKLRKKVKMNPMFISSVATVSNIGVADSALTNYQSTGFYWVDNSSETSFQLDPSFSATSDTWPEGATGIISTGSNNLTITGTGGEIPQFIKSNLPYDTNIVQQLKILKKALDTELYKSVISYDDIVIPTNWLVQRQLSGDIKAAKKAEETIVYNMGEPIASYQRECVKLEELGERFNGFIIYGYEEEEFLLTNFATLLKRSIYCDKWPLKESLACRVYKTAKRNGKQFQKLKNAVHVTRFINDNKIFRHFATTLAISKKIEEIEVHNVEDKRNIGFNNALNLISPEKFDKKEEVEKFIFKYGRTLDGLDKDFIESIISVADEYSLYDEDIIKEFNEFAEYINKLNLLNHISYTYEALPYVIDYFVLKKKPVSELWTKPKEYEVALIKENIDKLNYKLSITNEIIYRRHSSNQTNPVYETLQDKFKIQNAFLTYYKQNNYVTTERN